MWIWISHWLIRSLSRWLWAKTKASFVVLLGEIVRVCKCGLRLPRYIHLFTQITQPFLRLLPSSSSPQRTNRHPRSLCKTARDKQERKLEDIREQVYPICIQTQTLPGSFLSKATELSVSIKDPVQPRWAVRDKRHQQNLKWTITHVSSAGVTDMFGLDRWAFLKDRWGKPQTEPGAS